MSRKEVMEGAKYSKFDAESGLTWVWYGGHGVHGYDLSKSDTPEVDIINVGDFSRDEATLSEVEHGVKNRMHDEEWNSCMTPEERGHSVFMEENLKREESHEKCPPGEHWVSGFSRTTDSYGNAHWVRGHCAKDPRRR